jgi:Ca2+-binding EF-hand superfamily protein
MDKFRKIRDKIQKNRDSYNWASDASYEVITLQKIQEDVEYDMRRQHCRTARAVQHIQWTMAPNGFANRRGASERGPLLGAGPLPPNATSALKDPRIDQTMSQFQWDAHGRRHKKKIHSDETSIMDTAMKAIRTAASNASLYKLDLQRVFEDIDVSGDGHITIDEMAMAFESMGVTLDDLVLDALFRHFDPNNSGSVQFGEFQWAFFNRRSMMKQWKTGTKGMSKRQIEIKFRHADTSGNGLLNEREFKKLLLSFGIKLSASDQDLLLRRFDVDGDGELDLREFVEFINKDINPDSESMDTTASSTGKSGGHEMSLSSTIPYDQLPASQKTQKKAETNVPVSNLTVDNLFEKQKQIEKKLGNKYYSDK